MATRHRIDVDAILKAHGLTQEELGDEIGVDRRTIIRWKKGHAAPSPLARRQLQRYMRPKDGEAQTRHAQRKPLDPPSESPTPRGVIPGL